MSARSAPDESPFGDLTRPPAPLNPLIGRNREVKSLISLLESGGHRLVMVGGVVGVGKSRLIQEVASIVHESGDVPVIWVDQDSASGGERANGLEGRINAALSSCIGLDDVAATIGSNNILLVFTARRLTPPIDKMLRELLARCPGLQVLCESRRASTGPSASGCTVYPLSGLEVPGNAVAPWQLAQYPSVRLLSHYSGFGAESYAEAIATIVTICRYLDGIPQALVSAASWFSLYGSSHLLALVKDQPFQLTAPVSAPSQDLRKVFATFVNTLPEGEGHILRQLTQIRMPWTVKQAVAFLGEVTEVDVEGAIHQLILDGFVRPIRTPVETGTGAPRFAVLNLVRLVVEEGDAAAA